MKPLILYIFLFLHPLAIFSQSQHFFWEGFIRGQNGIETVPNAHIRVFSDGRLFLFAADDKGKATIRYYRPTETDTILVTSVGYKPSKLSCNKELLSLNEIKLELDVYSLNEVLVNPSKKRKTLKLGNTATFSGGSFSGTFNMQRGLLIKYDAIQGKILKIRYYIKSSLGEEMRYCPFRVMIFDMDTINNLPGNNLLDDYLIVSSSSKKNWFEVDVSQYNIELPPKGVFVGMEILPFEYYFSKDMITSERHTIKGAVIRSNGETKKGDLSFFNSINIGMAKNSKKSESCESWTRHLNVIIGGEWKQITYSKGNFLINIEVEKTD